MWFVVIKYSESHNFWSQTFHEASKALPLFCQCSANLSRDNFISGLSHQWGQMIAQNNRCPPIQLLSNLFQSWGKVLCSALHRINMRFNVSATFAIKTKTTEINDRIMVQVYVNLIDLRIEWRMYDWKFECFFYCWTTLHFMRTNRLYRRVKIHKQIIDLRPILPMAGSPYLFVVRWLCQQLEPKRKRLSKYSPKDTFEFIDHIKDNNVMNKYISRIPLLHNCQWSCYMHKTMETHTVT